HRRSLPMGRVSATGGPRGRFFPPDRLMLRRATSTIRGFVGARLVDTCGVALAARLLPDWPGWPLALPATSRGGGRIWRCVTPACGDTICETGSWLAGHGPVKRWRGCFAVCLFG